MSAGAFSDLGGRVGAEAPPHDQCAAGSRAYSDFVQR